MVATGKQVTTKKKMTSIMIVSNRQWLGKKTKTNVGLLRFIVCMMEAMLGSMDW